LIAGTFALRQKHQSPILQKIVREKGTWVNLFDDMTVFVRAVEAGSFSDAARRLGVAKSVVSRRIGSLEGF
jgi:hypothetical protein